MVERVPGRWPLSSPCRRRRWPEGQALQGPSVPGYNRHQRTDGLRFKTSRSPEASCRGAQSPIPNSIEPYIDYLFDYQPLRRQAIQRARHASRQDTEDTLFFGLPPILADRCIEIYLESASFAEANSWSSTMLTYASDFTAEQQRRILKGIGENDQLYNSNSVGSVINKLRQSKKLPAAGFEELLEQSSLVIFVQRAPE
jgi:hypothetical protein